MILPNPTRLLFLALLIFHGTAAWSADNDPSVGCPYATRHAAAAAVLNSLNPVSIRENREYGGYLFYLPSKGYCFTEPTAGNYGNVNFASNAKGMPANAVATATWHTHGAAMAGVISEIFSPRDMELNQRLQLDGYLATPSGAFKFLPLGSKTTHLLGVVATTTTQ